MFVCLRGGNVLYYSCFCFLIVRADRLQMCVLWERIMWANFMLDCVHSRVKVHHCMKGEFEDFWNADLDWILHDFLIWSTCIHKMEWWRKKVYTIYCYCLAVNFHYEKVPFLHDNTSEWVNEMHYVNVSLKMNVSVLAFWPRIFIIQS